MKKAKKATLNPKQEYFCELYATNREFFGNGVQAYMEAYGIDASNPGAVKSARTMASTLLTNVNILARIREKMDTATLNDEFVDKELSFIIEQDADMGTKMRGIAEYNKLKTRITDKIDHTSGGKPLGMIVLPPEKQ